MANQIAPSDLQLFHRASEGLRTAQANFEFANRHIGETYQLTQEDKVDLATGAITRAPKPKAASVKALDPGVVAKVAKASQPKKK